MLRKLYVHNFKTLLNFTFEPKGISLIIGRNNSGKTNVCQALRFLAQSAWGKLEEAAVSSVGSPYSLANRYIDEDTADFRCECELPSQDGTTHAFEYSLSVLVPKLPALDTSLRVASEILRVSGGQFDRTELIHNVRGEAWIVNETDRLGSPPRRYGVDQAPVDRTVLSEAYDSRACRLVHLFKSHLLWWLFYDLQSNRLRAPESSSAAAALAPDGGNLASVVHALKARDDSAYREVLHLVRTVEKDLEAINFDPSPAPELVFMTFEHAARRRFRPQELSNGTLRMLALAYIIASNRTAAHDPFPLPRLNVIEEPDTGIFVGHLKELFRSLDHTGQSGQFILTTHQPYLIDLFDAHLDSVFVLKREPTHTVLVRPDREKVTEWLREMSLGEMHFREMLGA